MIPSYAVLVLLAYRIMLAVHYINIHINKCFSYPIQSKPIPNNL